MADGPDRPETGGGGGRRRCRGPPTTRRVAGRGPGRRRGGRSRPGPAREARRRPLGQGRRPRRQPDRRGLRRGVPGRRARPGGAAAGGGGPEDQGPAAERGPGPGGGAGRLGGRAARIGATTRRGPTGWPRPPAWPTPTPGATSSAPRRPRPPRTAARSCSRPWPARRSSRNWGRSASTCWAMAWPPPETWRRPRRSCAGPWARHPGDVWVNYDLAEVLVRIPSPRRGDPVLHRRAGHPARDGALPGAHAGQEGGIRRGDRGLPRPGPAPARERSPPVLPGGGVARRAAGRAEAAETMGRAVVVLREEIRLRPDDAPTHFTSSATPCGIEGRSTKPSPNSARRSGCGPTSSTRTATSATS